VKSLLTFFIFFGFFHNINAFSPAKAGFGRLPLQAPPKPGRLLFTAAVRVFYFSAALISSVEMTNLTFPFIPFASPL
jgi:hypothetical protein